MTRGKKLTSLEVSDNGTVTDRGVAVLRNIQTLRRLKLQNLAGRNVLWFYTVFLPLVVEVLCVLFLDYALWLGQKQNT